MEFIKLFLANKGFRTAEMEYWWLRLKCALGLTDEYRPFRPYHIQRMFSDDVKPLFPVGHDVYETTHEWEREVDE